eukprot:1202375-Prymnesium_polylepis.1
MSIVDAPGAVEVSEPGPRRSRREKALPPAPAPAAAAAPEEPPAEAAGPDASSADQRVFPTAGTVDKPRVKLLTS